MKLDNDTQYFMNPLHNLNAFFFVQFGCLFYLFIYLFGGGVKYGANGHRNQLTSIYFKIDKANAAVEPRKGTVSVSAMFLAVFAARMVYSMIFLKWSVVGIMGFLMWVLLRFWAYIYCWQ
jgi:hypothetical protein